jgi:hypothetical protein
MTNELDDERVAMRDELRLLGLSDEEIEKLVPGRAGFPVSHQCQRVTVSVTKIGSAKGARTSPQRQK